MTCMRGPDHRTRLAPVSLAAQDATGPTRVMLIEKGGAARLPRVAARLRGARREVYLLINHHVTAATPMRKPRIDAPHVRHITRRSPGAMPPKMLMVRPYGFTG